MKRLLYLALVIAISALPMLMAITPAHADALTQSACRAITLDEFHTDACNAEIQANPMPALVHPAPPTGKTYGYSTPRGVLFPSNPLPYEFGWILKDWYFSDKPGGAISTHPPADHKLAKASIHYIYASVTVKGMEWDMIGPDQWIAGENIARLFIPKRPDKVSGRWITLDLARQTLIAMQDDTPVFATLISAGFDGYGFTRVGLFHIYARTRFTVFRGPPWKVVPDYILNHVPDAMFFDGHIALHGAYWHDWFGFPRSHGCVNIPVGDESWLWNWVSEALNNPDESKFFLDDPSKAPWVYVYKSGRPMNQG